MKGQVRNDVYPTEPGLISDFTISHKFGATAGLEVACLNKRVLLINNIKTKSCWDNLYEQSDIVFSNIDEILKVIDDYRVDKIKNKNLGDWSKIINNFDPYIDNLALKRLRNHINYHIDQ